MISDIFLAQLDPTNHINGSGGGDQRVAVKTKVRSFRNILYFLPAAILLLLGFLTLCVIQTSDCSITGKPTRDFVWIIGITELAIYVWIRVYAQVRLKTQITALAIVYGIQLCLYFCVRIDGFMGDGRPILAWRWTQTAERKWTNGRQHEYTGNAIATANLATTTAFDYPTFRGIDRTGCVQAVTLARTWTERPRELWRQSVGLGWSSFAVVGNYCVTQEQRGEFETVVCYELRTGREIWIHSDFACFDEVTGGKGPRATPTIHRGRVFALGATGILNCLDGKNGRRVWSTNILTDNDAENALFGMSGSPLVVNGLVVVSPGGKYGSLAAYDEQTGSRVWVGGHAGASYSSPQYADFVERPQILIFNAEGLFGHDAGSGRVLWSFPWVSNPAEKNNVCQPVAIPSGAKRPPQVLISSGYGNGCALLDITQRGESFHVRERWRNRNLKAKFSSVVRRGQYVFGLDERILVCIDLLTGNRCWKGGRYGYGQLVLADDLLIVQSETGEIVLVEASSTRHHELGRFAALDDRTWNHPVVSGDILLVRNDREAACYRLPASEAP